MKIRSIKKIIERIDERLKELKELESKPSAFGDKRSECDILILMECQNELRELKDYIEYGIKVGDEEKEAVK